LPGESTPWTEVPGGLWSIELQKVRLKRLIMHMKNQSEKSKIKRRRRRRRRKKR
jgi:hypothetical protein